MKKIFKKHLLLLLLFINSYLVSAQFNFQRDWGTYFGDERFTFSSSVIDNLGNLYIVGTIDGIDSSNLISFTNSSSYHQNYGGGNKDGFLVKFSPQGTIIWGTFIGGENEDFVGDIAIDQSNNLYIVGGTYSITNISTPNSYQENNLGNGDYFISKFNQNGNIIWSTYYGGSGYEYANNAKLLKIAHDGGNGLYLAAPTSTDNLSTPNVFQETNLNNTSNSILTKFDALTSSRIWSTYFGLNTNIRSIVADGNGLYVSGSTNDCPPFNAYNTYYGTSNGFKPAPSNCFDMYINKFNALNGQRVWGTYYGGTGGEFTNTKSLALVESSLFIAGQSGGSNNQDVATPGSFQPNNNGSSAFIAQFNQNGTRNWGTFLGNLSSVGQGGGIANVAVDNQGNYYSFGDTNLIDMASTDGYKSSPNNTSSLDGFLVKFDGVTNQRVWGTYYGGVQQELDTSFQTYNNGSNFYIIGNTSSNDQIATTNGFQPNKVVFDQINNSPTTAANIYIAHFEPLPLSTTNFNASSISIFPNPSNGTIEIIFENNDFSNAKLELYDITGKLISLNQLNNKYNSLTFTNISQGLYFAKITNFENVTVTKKIIFN